MTFKFKFKSFQINLAN